MAPLYQVMALPGSTSQAQTFTVTDAYVPASESNASGANNPNLSAFMVGTSDPGDYGQLTVYETPQGTTGPANADAYIQQNQTVSKDITLLVPVGQSLIYLRPLYVASSSIPQPQLTYVVGVLGQKVVVETTVAQTLSDLLHTPVTSGGSQAASGTTPTLGTVPAAVQQDLALAQTDYANAQAALAAGSLGTYQSDIAAMNQEIANAQAALSAASPTTSTSTTTTTTPKKAKSSSKSKTPTSTEPKSSSTTTTLASAAAR
jgi:uncharacterized membrane protein (UPF0182 family)